MIKKARIPLTIEGKAFPLILILASECFNWLIINQKRNAITRGFKIPLKYIKPRITRVMAQVYKNADDVVIFGSNDLRFPYALILF